MKQRIDVFAYVALLALCIVTLAMMTGPNAEEFDAMQYCKMVHAQKVDHTVGWPDFRGDYAEQCNPDGTVDKQYSR